MFDKHDARKLLKTAMGVEEDDKLKNGVRAEDVSAMFKYVQALYEAEGRQMRFTWVRIGKNHAKKGEGWKGEDCIKTFSNPGKFIVLGKAKKNNKDYAKIMKALSKKKLSEVERSKKFALYAKGTKKINHAISVVIYELGGGVLFDNGCGEKEYSIVSIASRMEDISVCYRMDLSIV